MSERIALRLTHIGKMYKLYPNRLDNFLDALGLAPLMPWRRVKPREFWALRDISLELKAGSRLGIIGRNGAGKSTLLKLITGNLTPSEGEITINGQVQALLEAGAGFHPEFTGYENIRAALLYQGFSPQEIAGAVEEIADFTELGHFLAQPFKTYSTGMQTRLVFATATVLKPDIFIIDEILGAGDAYFAHKSAERMQLLVEESGASVLLVSHVMEQIVRYCEECVWIERGRMVKRGPSMEVVDAYEGFIRALEDRRLQAKNHKRQTWRYAPGQWDGYGDVLAPIFEVQGAPGARCDIAAISLLKDGQLEEVLKVGDVQDAHGAYAAALSLEGSQWSEPRRATEGFYRSLEVQPGGPAMAAGSAFFYAYALFEDANYAFQVRYRCQNVSQLWLTLFRNGFQIGAPVELPRAEPGWREWSLPVMTSVPVTHSGSLLEPAASAAPATAPQHAGPGDGRAVIRWPSEGSLTIEKVVLLGEHAQEQTVFAAGSAFTLRLTILAHRDGDFNLVLGATLYRLDGILIANFVSQPLPLQFVKGETRACQLELNPLRLGDGHFVFSLSIFEQVVAEHSRYDLISRAYEFQVVGNDPVVANAVFQHPGHWTLV